MAGHSTLRQERYAELEADPTIKTRTEAALRAGYSLGTADKSLAKIQGSEGLRRAREARIQRELDKGRELKALSEACLKTSAEDVKTLDIRDRLALGLQAAKIAHEIGEPPIDVQMDYQYFLRWKRRFFALAVLVGRLAERAQRASDVPPTASDPIAE